MVYGILVSRVGMARDDDQTLLTGPFCELPSRISVERRRVHAHDMHSMKAWSAEEAARSAARRKMVEDNKDSGSSSPFMIEQSAVWSRPGSRRRVEKERNREHLEVESMSSTKEGCSEPDIALGFPRRVLISSELVLERPTAARTLRLQ